MKVKKNTIDRQYDQKYWGTVSAVAGAVAALAALVAISLSVSNSNWEREGQRPYIALSNESQAGIINGKDNVPLAQITFRNIGSWSAEDIRIAVFIFDDNLFPRTFDTIRIANPLSPKTASTVSSPLIPISGRSFPNFFVYYISYSDSKTNDSFKQEFYMKLPASNTSIPNAILADATFTERERLRNIISNDPQISRAMSLFNLTSNQSNSQRMGLFSILMRGLPIFYALIGGGFVAVLNYRHERKFIRNRKRLILLEIQSITEDVASLLTHPKSYQWIKQHLSSGVYWHNQGILGEHYCPDF